MTALTSSEAFIRALRASADPPAPGGLLKIELATQAWALSSLYVPSKGELITEWILSRLLKDKGRDRATNPIFDNRYWRLLSIVLVDVNTKSRAVPDTTTIWLVPLLSRIPIFPVLGVLIHNLETIPSDCARDSLYALRSILPLALPKASFDAILECLWETFAVFSSASSLDAWVLDERHAQITHLAVESFESAFLDYGNKKKTHTIFVEQHVRDWSRCQVVLASTSHVGLATIVKSSGAAILYGSDVLRLHLDPDEGASKLPSIFSSLTPSPNHPMTFSDTMTTLPIVFSLFVSQLQKHRSIVFARSQGAQGLAKTQVKKHGMKFLAECLKFVDGFTAVDVQYPDLGRHQWTARANLLIVMDDEALFQNTDTEARDMLVAQARLVVESGSLSDSDPDVVNQAIIVLNVLIRVDYDLVAPVIPSILPSIGAASAPAHASAHQFLMHHLSYHTKTRTLNDLISALTDALQVNSDLYATVSTGPIFGLEYQDQLCTALSAFLSPSQILGVVSSLADTLDSAWQTHHAQQRPSPRKKRKLVHRTTDATDRVAPARVCLITSLVAIVIPSLPIHTISTESIVDITERLAALRQGTMTDAIRAVSGDGLDGDVYGIQMVAAAMMRLAYVAQSGGPIWGVTSSNSGGPSNDEVSQLLRSSTTLPELVLEVTRSALQHLTTVPFPLFTVPDDLIDIILDRLDAASVNATWDGAFATLDASSSGQTALGIALWSVVLDRRIHTIDQFASVTQLARFTEMLLRLNSLSSQAERPSLLTLHAVIRRGLGSAAFWDLSNIRTALLATLERQTSLFLEYNLENNLRALSNSPASLKPIIDDDAVLSQAMHAFRFALELPSEYFDRSTRIELVGRALAADVLFAVSGPETMKNRTLLRAFVLHAGKDSNGADVFVRVHVIDSLHSLLMTRNKTNYPLVQYLSSARDKVDDLFEQVTLELLELAFLGAVRSSDTTLLQKLVNDYTNFDFDGSNPTLPAQGLLVLLKVLTENALVTKLSSALLASLASLGDVILAELRPRLASLATTDTGPESMVNASHIIGAWQICLRFHRWLGTAVMESHIGMSLVKSLASTTQTSSMSVPNGLYESILSLLVEELQGVDTIGRFELVNGFVAGYIAFHEVLRSSGSSSTAPIVARFSKTLAAEEYASVLEALAFTLTSSRRPPLEKVAILRISEILMLNVPEASHKSAQQHCSLCLQTLAAVNYFEDPILAIEAFNFILNQCGERASSLRTVDISCIWIAFARGLAGSPSHNSTTSEDVYLAITSSVMALVRLRRDLVSATLPHLSALLIRLVGVLRAVRPELGAAQRRSITETLPFWISPSAPVGARTAKAFARLLTSLTTKTTVRTRGADVAQKAQSLAGPFSKHAPYVLTAYLKALTDPLCVYSPAVRSELEPGLFALCEMMGEHGRDSIMAAMLDGGSQAMLKIIWKEYEKQRYIGKG